MSPYAPAPALAEALVQAPPGAPIPSTPAAGSPWYVGDRYIADASLAARERQLQVERAAERARCAAAVAERRRQQHAAATLERVARVCAACEGLGADESAELLADLRALLGVSPSADTFEVAG